MTAPRLLCLDLGTQTGFAFGDGNTHISGTVGFRPSRYDGAGMRFVKFRTRLKEWHDAFSFSQVYFEEVRRHAGTDAAHVYGGLMATLQAWCEENAIPYGGVPVGTIKRWATGKGNADKAAMLEAIRSWGYEPVDDNEADAIALLRMQLVEVGAVKESEARALDRVAA